MISCLLLPRRYGKPCSLSRLERCFQLGARNNLSLHEAVLEQISAVWKTLREFFTQGSARSPGGPAKPIRAWFGQGSGRRAWRSWRFNKKVVAVGEQGLEQSAWRVPLQAHQKFFRHLHQLSMSPCMRAPAGAQTITTGARDLVAVSISG